MTNLLPIGPATLILQNVVWAVPGVSCNIQTTAVLQSSLTVAGTYSNFASDIVTGCFVKCITGNATVTLRKNGVG